MLMQVLFSAFFFFNLQRVSILSAVRYDVLDDTFKEDHRVRLNEAYVPCILIEH